MKTIFISAIVAIATIATVSAQPKEGAWTIEGSLSVSAAQEDPSVGDKTKFISLDIAPAVGYSLSDKFQVGLGLGFDYTKVSGNDAGYVFRVAPFARQFWSLSNTISFAARESIYVGFGQEEATKADIFEVGINASPEFWFKVSPKSSIYTGIGRVVVDYNTIDNNGKTKTIGGAVEWDYFRFGYAYTF